MIQYSPKRKRMQSIPNLQSRWSRCCTLDFQRIISKLKPAITEDDRRLQLFITSWRRKRSSRRFRKSPALREIRMSRPSSHRDRRAVCGFPQSLLVASVFRRGSLHRYGPVFLRGFALSRTLHAESPIPTASSIAMPVTSCSDTEGTFSLSAY